MTGRYNNRRIVDRDRDGERDAVFRQDLDQRFLVLKNGRITLSLDALRDALGIEAIAAQAAAGVTIDPAATEVAVFEGAGADGLVPDPGSETGLFLKDDGTWAAPGGGGGGVPTSRLINTTAPLTGGGDLTADRTLAVSDATTTSKGVVELATSGENAANVVVQGNDSRLSDSRAPTGAASGDLTGTYPGPTIAAGVVSNSKLANMANGTYKARITAGAGAPEDIPLAGTAFPTSPIPVDGQMFYRTDHRTAYVYNATTSVWLSIQVHEVPYGQTTATATNGFFRVGGSNGSALYSANFGHVFGFNVAIVGISWRSVGAPSTGTATIAVFANNVAVASATMNVGAADLTKTREDFLPAAGVTAGQILTVKNTGAATSATAAQGVIRLRRRET